VHWTIRAAVALNSVIIIIDHCGDDHIRRCLYIFSSQMQIRSYKIPFEVLNLKRLYLHLNNMQTFCSFVWYTDLYNLSFLFRNLWKQKFKLSVLKFWLPCRKLWQPNERIMIQSIQYKTCCFLSFSVVLMLSFCWQLLYYFWPPW